MAEIYVLASADGEIRYIGKANNAEKRFATHLSDARRRKTPVCNWIRKLVDQGERPHMLVMASTLTDDWQSVERAMIAQYREDGFDLLNLADGGNEPKPTHEQRAKAARAACKVRQYGPLSRVNALKHQMGGLLYWAKRSGRIDSPHWRKIRARLRYCSLKRPELFALWANV